MVFLIIKFAAKKADLLRLREEILTTLQRRNITVNASSPPEEIGILADAGQAALFRYKWPLELLSKVNKSILEALKKNFLNKEVHDIRLEGKA